MAILDGRTLVDNANVLDPGGNGVWEDDGGTAMNVNQNTDNFVFGTASVSDRLSSSRGGILFNAEAAIFSAGDVCYIWALTTLASALLTKDNAGMTMRFTGPTETDFFEVNIAGSDTYGGGWKMFVVDVDLAAAKPDATGGTPPAVTAVEKVGIMFDNTGTSIPGSADSIFVDAIWRLPVSTPGIRIEGRTGGSLPWTVQDVIDAGDIADPTKAWGTIDRLDNGTVITNTPWRFGADDGTIDEFADGGEVIGWEIQPVRDGFYGFDTIAGAGAQSLVWGTKVGSGQAATGVGGMVVVTGGPRWFFNAVDSDQDEVGLFGCQFSGSGLWDISQTAVEVRSCVYSDCDSIIHDNGCTLTKCSFDAAPGPKAQVLLNSAPADGDFDGNQFTNMLWFAIEISENGPVTYDLRGVTYSGNGTDRDILCSHNSGEITLAVLETGGTPGVTNGATITITTAGAAEIAMTAIGLSNVNQTTPSPESNGDSDIAGGDPLTAAVTADGTDNFLAAVYGSDVLGTVDWSGSGAFVEEIDQDDIDGTVLLSAATKEGVSGSQTASANHDGTVLNAALTVVEIDAEAASPVVRVDPAFRPFTKENASTTLVFGWGVTGDASTDDLCALIMIVTKDPTAADTNVSTVSWGGTNMNEIREDFADDSGGGGEGLRTTVFELAGTNLEKGTVVVQAAVNIEANGVTEGAAVKVVADETVGTRTKGDTLSEGLANSLGIYSFTIDYEAAFEPSGLDVIVRAAQNGLPNAAVADDGAVLTDETTAANSTTDDDMTLTPDNPQDVNDAYYFGHSEQFINGPNGTIRLKVEVTQVHGAGNPTITWEFWDGAWTALTFTDADPNPDFLTLGEFIYEFDAEAGWIVTTINSQGPFYYVRARVSGAGTSTNGARGRFSTLDVTKYFRQDLKRIVTSDGLETTVPWNINSLAQFDPAND